MPNRMVQVSPAQRAFLNPPPVVLVIDDDLEILDSLEMVLEGAGFRVLTARNGWEGLNVFRKHRPTVVVTDIMMPEQDGIGTIVQMRRERSDVKIVAMSGGGYIDTWDYLPTETARCRRHVPQSPRRPQADPDCLRARAIAAPSPLS